MINGKKKYDLEERTARFGESVIELCKKVPKNEITRPLINQLVKAATSVGAITVKPTMQKVKRILSTRSEYVKRNQENQNTF
jgi:hypothetical protein